MMALCKLGIPRQSSSRRLINTTNTNSDWLDKIRIAPAESRTIVIRNCNNDITYPLHMYSSIISNYVNRIWFYNGKDRTLDSCHALCNKVIFWGNVIWIVCWCKEFVNFSFRRRSTIFIPETWNTDRFFETSGFRVVSYHQLRIQFRFCFE